MNLYEFQGKQLFSEYGIKVPKGKVLSTFHEVTDIANPVVVKSQVLIGGRGKSGAIRFCNNVQEVKEAVNKCLSTEIHGHTANKVLVEEKLEIDKEFYLSIFVNRKNNVPTIMFSTKGGCDIEEVAMDDISSIDINVFIGLRPFMTRKILSRFALDATVAEGIEDTIGKLYTLFCEKKLQLVEINPLVLTNNGDIVAADAKIILDDNALDAKYKLNNQESGNQTAFEKALAERRVSAVEMDGDILVFGGGAGNGMATADSITNLGGTVRAIIDPAGALLFGKADQIEYNSEVMRLVSMLKPKVIFFNLYFQTARLDNAAKAIKRAFENTKTDIVVRLKGLEAKAGRELLSDTNFFVTESYKEACEIAVKISKEGK